jgi:hypothetical protein
VAEAVWFVKHRPGGADIVPALGLDVGLGVAGLVETKLARDALETAVGRYNATLPDR